jgi:tetratricopeptide (TPR) repeat protein
VSLYRTAVGTYLRTIGADHGFTVLAQVGLSRSLNGLGDFRGAEAAAREALAMYRKQPANRDIASAHLALGNALAGQRRYLEAVQPLRESVEIFEKGGRLRTPWYKPAAQSSLGAALAAAGDRVEAERLLLAGHEGLRDLPLTPATQIRVSIERLIAFYRETGSRENAAAWQKRLEELQPIGRRAEMAAIR